MEEAVAVFGLAPMTETHMEHNEKHNGPTDRGAFDKDRTARGRDRTARGRDRTARGRERASERLRCARASARVVLPVHRKRAERGTKRPKNRTTDR